MGRRRRRWRWLGVAFGALAAGRAVAAAQRLYGSRSLERTAGHEELDDPQVAQGFARVAEMPQMAALRWYAVRRALNLAHRGEAVDLGCGPGHLAIALARAAPGLRVTGIDLAEALLYEAWSRAESQGLSDRVRFRKGDVARLPFGNDDVDLVVSTLSLHHWSDPVAVLDEVARVLRPGGSFMVLDLQRDLAMMPWLLLWFATRFVVPAGLRRVGEPMASRNAAYTPEEAGILVGESRLDGWRVTRGPLWLTIEGTKEEGSRV